MDWPKEDSSQEKLLSLHSANISIYIHYTVIPYYVNPSLIKECTPTHAYKDAS